jgi:hypothetical protein
MDQASLCAGRQLFPAPTPHSRELTRGLAHHVRVPAQQHAEAESGTEVEHQSSLGECRALLRSEEHGNLSWYVRSRALLPRRARMLGAPVSVLTAPPNKPATARSPAAPAAAHVARVSSYHLAQPAGCRCTLPPGRDGVGRVAAIVTARRGRAAAVGGVARRRGASGLKAARGLRRGALERTKATGRKKERKLAWLRQCGEASSAEQRRVDGARRRERRRVRKRSRRSR